MCINVASPHRHSIRFAEYDYTQPGAYFVTIVTRGRKLIFGNVITGEMHLNEYGLIAQNEWFNTQILRPYVQLDPDGFVVMPNHIHGIIWIRERDNQPCSRGAAALRPYQYQSTQIPHVIPNSLGAIIRAYKSAVTYHINVIRSCHHLPVWQRNYYEHIIRNDDELSNISAYILINPQDWQNDPEYIA